MLQSADFQFGLEENSGAVYHIDMDVTFTFIAQKEESVIVKFNLHSGQKWLQNVPNTTLALCKCLHR